ncbi:MAG: hypothetical protein OEL53_18440 [Rhodospirillales bacterium]|nr:hypothetical protein [Rhodospirillales bacterium]
MRDIKAGRDINVQGDVNFVDNSFQPKLLAACSIDELYIERRHRNQLLSRERSRIWKIAGVVWFASLVLIGIAATIFYFQGKANLSSFVLGLAGLAGVIAGAKATEKPSVFEQRQLDALEEIGLLLRERGLE